MPINDLRNDSLPLHAPVSTLFQRLSRLFIVRRNKDILIAHARIAFGATFHWITRGED